MTDVRTFEYPADRGRALGEEIFAALARAQANAPRSKQSERRVLGMSEMGHCREYIRAMIAGDPKDPQTRLKWPAYIGTALGAKAEDDLGKEIPGTLTETRVSVRIPLPVREDKPQEFVTVSGSFDAAIYNAFGDGRYDVIDFKSKDGVLVTMSEGPPFKECAQISGYLIGGIEQGLWPEETLAHLVYIDRAGNDKHPYVYTITADEARAFLVMTGERIYEVAQARAAGISQSYLRDMPESWCFHVSCPFYTACWSGYEPDGELTTVWEIAAVELYKKGRDLGRLADQYKRTAKGMLMPDPTDFVHRSEGRTHTDSLRWTERAYDWGIGTSIDIRPLPPAPPTGMGPVRKTTRKKTTEENPTS